MIGTYILQPSDARYAITTNINHVSALAVVDNLTNEIVYIANTNNNTVTLYSFPSDDPTPPWQNLTNSIAANNIQAAVANFSSNTANDYYQAFLSLGRTTSLSDISQIASLTPVSIGNDTAEYYFEKTVAGTTFYSRLNL